MINSDLQSGFIISGCGWKWIYSAFVAGIFPSVVIAMASFRFIFLVIPRVEPIKVSSMIRFEIGMTVSRKSKELFILDLECPSVLT